MRMRKFLSILLVAVMLVTMFRIIPPEASASGAAAEILSESGTQIAVYENFQTALDALADHQTLRLLRNVHLDTRKGTGYGFTLNKELTDVTIDGAGYSLYGYLGGSGPFLLTLRGHSVTVRDLGVIGSDACAQCISVMPGQEVVLENVRLSANLGMCVWCENGSQKTTLTMRNCFASTTRNILAVWSNTTATVENCVFLRGESTNANTRMFNLLDSATVTVNGGYYSDFSGVPILANMGSSRGGKLTVNSGTFVTDAEEIIQCEGSVTVNGGVFVNPNEGNPEFIHGYASVKNSFCTVMTRTLGKIVNEANLTATTVAPRNGEVFYLSSPLPLPRIEPGASVRVTETDAGIRFRSTVPAELIAYAEQNKDAGTDLQIGTLITPTDRLTCLYTFTKEALDAYNRPYVDVVATGKGTARNPDGSVTVSASLIGIRPANADRPFSAVSYLTYYQNGIARTVYSAYDPSENSHSMREVCEDALRTPNGLTDAERETLRSYLG